MVFGRGGQCPRRPGEIAFVDHQDHGGAALPERLGDQRFVIDRTIGLEHLRCLHLNDSKVPFGSRRDRHSNLTLRTLADLEDAAEVAPGHVLWAAILREDVP